MSLHRHLIPHFEAFELSVGSWGLSLVSLSALITASFSGFFRGFLALARVLRFSLVMNQGVWCEVRGLASLVSV